MHKLFYTHCTAVILTKFPGKLYDIGCCRKSLFGKQNLSYFCLTPIEMKTRFLSLLLLLGLASCTKNPPPIIDNPDQPDEIKSYGGTYYGSVYKHSAGVDADGVYKTDTTLITV